MVGSRGSLGAAFLDRLLTPLALWQIVSCLLTAADGYAKNAFLYLAMFFWSELRVCFDARRRRQEVARGLIGDHSSDESD